MGCLYSQGDRFRKCWDPRSFTWAPQIYFLILPQVPEQPDSCSCVVSSWKEWVKFLDQTLLDPGVWLGKGEVWEEDVLPDVALSIQAILPSIHASNHPSIHPSIHPSNIHPSIHPSIMSSLPGILFPLPAMLIGSPFPLPTLFHHFLRKHFCPLRLRQSPFCSCQKLRFLQVLGRYLVFPLCFHILVQACPLSSLSNDSVQFGCQVRGGDKDIRIFPPSC